MAVGIYRRDKYKPPGDKYIDTRLYFSALVASRGYCQRCRLMVDGHSRQYHSLIIAPSMDSSQCIV